MAEAGPKVEAQIAVIPATKCEWCEENEIKWKCFTCEEYLCGQCKKLHLKSKASRDHRVTTIEGAEKFHQYGEWEKDDSKCDTHSEEELNLFCRSCDLPICRECIIKETHHSHTIQKLEEALDGKQQELSTIIRESSQKLSKVEENITCITKVKSAHSRDISACIAEVRSRNTQIKASSDQITDEVVTRLQKMEKDKEEIMKQREKCEEEQKTILTKITDSCKEKQNQKGVGLFKFVTQVRQSLDECEPKSPPAPISAPVFRVRDPYIQDLRDLFGNVIAEKKRDQEVEKDKKAVPIHIKPQPNVKVLSTFPMTEVYSIAAVSSGQAWIENFERRRSVIRLTTASGEVIQTLNPDFTVANLAVSKSGELYTTKLSFGKVTKLNQNKVFTKFYETVGYTTKGVTVTNNNHVVVCLYREGDGKLVELSSSGQVVRTIQFDSDGKTPLFQDPYRVGCNINEDLVVVDYKTKLVVLDKTGKKRFTYAGRVEGLKEAFDPYDTTTDQHGNILVSDGKNNAIHMIDKDGNFLCFILTEKDGLQGPKGLSVDTSSGRLWVGCYGNDKVMVVKYM